MNSQILVFCRRSFATVKAHVPMIKFRKGGNEGAKSAGYNSQPNTSAHSGPRPVLEYHQLPLRYRRAPLDDLEINIINSGGAI